MTRKYQKEEIIKGVLDFIKDTKAPNVLTEVAGHLNHIVYNENQTKTATIFTVYKLSEDLKNIIKKKLEEIIKKEVNLREIVDAKIIGGFKIKFGDWVYDASLKGQLETIKSKIYDNVI